VIKGLLHHLEHLLLHDACFFADADYKITFCHRFCAVKMPPGLSPELDYLTVTMKLYRIGR
jgi:hypothetical protein